MYRDRIANTPVKSPAAEQLQNTLLAYHDFQARPYDVTKTKQLADLSQWQSKRLLKTHADLYARAEYNAGLQFLLSELYSPQDFSQRDQDLERIFPKLIKLVPNKILGTVNALIELNLLTQQLDETMRATIFETLGESTINESIYCNAFRLCANQTQREHQLQLVDQVGQSLTRYANNSVIKYSLKLTEGPAQNAGLGALHDFIQRGFLAFHSMHDIHYLMHTVISRETRILSQIYHQAPNAFTI